MAYTGYAYGSYTAVGIREDLTDVIANISPTETPMWSSFAKVRAYNRKHEWQTDSLSSPTSANKYVEGVSYNEITTDRVSGATTRVANTCQVLAKAFSVTGSIEAMRLAGRSSQYQYNLKKALKTLALDIEWALHNGVGTDGDATTAREMSGIITWLSTATNSNTISGDGLSLSESQYNSILSEAWTDGGNPDTTYVGGGQKRKISAFTGSNTRNIDITDHRIIANVDVYESDYGLQVIVLDRVMQGGSSNSGANFTQGTNWHRVLCLENGACRVAQFRPITMIKVAKQGDSEAGMVIAELTLEVLAPTAHAAGRAFSTVT